MRKIGTTGEAKLYEIKGCYNREEHFATKGILLPLNSNKYTCILQNSASGPAAWIAT